MRQLDHDVIRNCPDAGHAFRGTYGTPFLAVAGGVTVEGHRPVPHQDANVGDIYAWLIFELGEYIGFDVDITFSRDRFHRGSVFCFYSIDELYRSLLQRGYLRVPGGTPHPFYCDQNSAGIALARLWGVGLPGLTGSQVPPQTLLVAGSGTASPTNICVSSRIPRAAIHRP
jgi:hypothetical protein